MTIKYPVILMTNINKLHKVYNIITKEYNYNEDTAKLLLSRNILVFSKPFNYTNINHFFMTYLGIEPGTPNFRRVLLRAPFLLTYNIDWFCIPVIHNIQNTLLYSTKEVQDVVGGVPQVSIIYYCVYTLYNTCIILLIHCVCASCIYFMCACNIVYIYTI